MFNKLDFINFLLEKKKTMKEVKKEPNMVGKYPHFHRFCDIEGYYEPGTVILPIPFISLPVYIAYQITDEIWDTEIYIANITVNNTIYTTKYKRKIWNWYLYNLRIFGRKIQTIKKDTEYEITYIYPFKHYAPLPALAPVKFVIKVVKYVPIYGEDPGSVGLPGYYEVD